MKNIHYLSGLLMVLAVVCLAKELPAADETNDTLVDTIVGLLNDKDKDMRAIGLQQVREEVKGEAATKRFAELLPKLSPDAREGLIDALGARGDKTARPAILELLKSSEKQDRTAAIRALGFLGEADDLPILVQFLSTTSQSEKDAAIQTLSQMVAKDANEKIVQALKDAKTPDQQIALIGIIENRKIQAAVPLLLDIAISGKSNTSAAAMASLGQMAGEDAVPELVQSLLKTQSAAQREAAEKTIMFVCQKNKDPEKRADPLLAVWDKLDEDQKTILLPAIGRVGGSKALKIVDQALADNNTQRRDAGIRALCNWPDASAIERLLNIAQTSENENYRLSALRALPRVAVLRDSRSNAEKIDLLKKVMSMANRDEERILALDRAKAVRSMDSVRFILSYTDKPELAQRACASLVELAHYRELREPNKVEFDKALDKVIGICKDPILVDYAKRYQRGETVENRSKPNR